MEFSEDFELPPIEVAAKPVPEVQANDDAFYAAGSYGQDPVNDYTKIYSELTQDGYSESLEAAKRSWQTEQSSINKEAVLGILNDPTIPRDQKKNILSTYSVTGYISSDLKDKYVQKMASLVQGDTHLDAEAQDANIVNLPVKLANVKGNENTENHKKLVDVIFDNAAGFQHTAFQDSVIRKPDGTVDWAKTYSPSKIAKDATGGLLSIANLITSIPNFAQSLAGALGADFGDLLLGQKIEWEKNLQLGKDQATQGINSYFDWRLNGLAKKIGVEKEFNDAIVNKIFNNIGEGIQWLDDRSVEKGYTEPGLVKTVADSLMLFGSPLLKGAKTIKGKVSGAIDKGLEGQFAFEPTGLDVRAGSPIDVTNQANPAAASKIIKAGIEDTTGQVATSTGAGEPGVLIHKYVMPKTLQELPDVRNNPDLHKDIIESTKSLEQVLEDTQFDPNVIDIDVRLNDIDAVTKIINEKQAPTYQQSNSRVNVADNVFEFKAVFGRDSNYFYNSRESVITAYNNLKTLVEALPAEERGSVYITDRITGQKYTPDSLRADPKFTADVMENKQFAVEWEYKKEYDLLDAVLSGPDSVKTVMNFFGARFDLSKILQAPFGKWITPTGKFNPVIERGLGRLEERAGYLSAQTLNIIKQELGDGKLKNELATVVFETQTRGKDVLSIGELRQIFGSKLSKAQYDALYRKQVFWRQVNYFDLALTDRARRNELLSTGFNKGIYKEGKYIGAARTEFAFLDEGGLPPVEVWDASLELPVLFELDKSKTEGVFDIGGKQLVVLEKGITDITTGKSLEYALVGDKVKLDVLPQKVVRRIPGYSPLLYKEHFFLDLIPKKLNLNGRDVTNPNKLKNYYKTVAAASTKIEIDALKKEFERRHPDYEIVSRKATESLKDKISLYEVHGDIVRNAMKKGQQLPSLHGLAKIEDPLVSLIKSSRSLATLDAFRSYKTVFETYWVKNYKEFFPRAKEGETIPPRVDLIERLPARDMSPELEAKYKRAVAEYELYSTTINVGELPGITQKSLVAVADILENYKVPSRVLRETGQKTYPIRALNKLGSLFFITLAPIRQWLVQLQPIADFTAASALKGVTGNFKGMVQAPKNVALAFVTRIALLEEARMLKPYRNRLSKAAHSFISNIITKEEFDANLKAIKESGLMQSIDHNLMINQILTDTSRPLIETPLEKAGAIATMVPSATVKLSRTVGFDAAEMTNRLFMWHMAKDFWMEQNPGKNWNTPANREIIAYEGNRLAGGMNRAQSFPYQRGALSSLMQFGAIMQKQFLLGFQEGGSILSNADRARLLAARGILWGTAGVVGAKLITDLLAYGSNDPDVIKYKNQIDRGLADRIGNGMFKAMFGDDGEKDPDLNFSKTLNPYGESNLGLPYVDLMIEAVKLLNGDPAGFRFPAIGALGRIAETINTLNSWVITEKISDQKLEKAILEAARFSSGMDNWAKGQLMLAINDKITKQGQRLGLNSTKTEALAQMMFGITTFREEDLWAAAKVATSETEKVKKMAQNIHKEIVKIINDPAIANDPDLEDKKRKMGNAFLSVLAEDEVNWPSKTIQEVREQIWEIDKRMDTTVKQSLTGRTLKKVGSENDRNNQELQNKLKDNKNESTFRLMNIIRGRENP